MKKYCMIFKIKEKFLKDYIEIHKNAWPEQIKAIKDSGAKKCVMYIHDNLSILYCECEDIEQWFQNLLNNETYQKWAKVTEPWMEQSESGDGSLNLLEKIFDLEQH
ncbi:MAG: L-rhamnose mutarotase [Actinobacteria bacterium]|nr:L-rhamnose mutarotase [Actinomycetota bacterium]